MQKELNGSRAEIDKLKKATLKTAQNWTLGGKTLVLLTISVGVLLWARERWASEVPAAEAPAAPAGQEKAPEAPAAKVARKKAEEGASMVFDRDDEAQFIKSTSIVPVYSKFTRVLTFRIYPQYKARRRQRIISPDRYDPFAAGVQVCDVGRRCLPIKPGVRMQRVLSEGVTERER